MVVLNYAKTSVRLAEADFHSRYLSERLPNSLRPDVQESAEVSIPGLPGVEVPDATAAVKTTRAITNLLLQAKAKVEAGDKVPLPSATAAKQLLKDGRTVFDTAVKLAGLNAELQKRQIAVPERLTDAAEYIAQCTAEFAEAKAKRALDEDAFDDALLTLRANLTRLARLASRAFESPGDGVAWLLESSREG